MSRTIPKQRPGLSPVLFSSTKVEWATPRKLFDVLHCEFGFDLDAAALKTNTKCVEYLGPDRELAKMRDGLAVEWALHGSVVWLNPPYGKGINLWMQKVIEAVKDGCTVVVLVPARVDTKWWFDFALQATEIRFIRGRLRFNEAGSAPFPSAILVYTGLSNGKPLCSWWKTGDLKAY